MVVLLYEALSSLPVEAVMLHEMYPAFTSPWDGGQVALTVSVFPPAELLPNDP
jgi:hypothetical protein